jgi:AcrR family transcriptional regulator
VGLKERKERQRRDVRDGILAAAREIASAEGWQALTIRGIAARIEYSPPVIYEHFSGKEEIISELTRQGYAEQLRAMEAARHAASRPEEALLAMARAYLAFAFGAPYLYQVMYGVGGVPFSASETRAEGEKTGAVVGEVVIEILRRHDKEADDVDGKVTLLWSTVHGLATLTLVGRIVGGQEQAQRLAAQAVYDSLAAWRQG